MSGAAGKRVGAGRLRVDAARAVDKLRDYQLPDPTMWVLEVVRAAVLAGATSIRVQGDADDVRVAWEGPPIGEEDAARLFDELVDPAPAMDRRHLRLLATGVNTALGLAHRWVDVICCDGVRPPQAVRYDARLLESKGDAGATGLRTLEAEPRRDVPFAPSRGVLVHLRRLPSVSALPIAVGFGEPAELSLVRQAADDVTVPLTVGQSTLGRAASHADLLRVGLSEGLEGFLALTDPSVAVEAWTLDVAELGVVLARYPLPHEETPRAKVPLRLFVDGARMPTNASRSAVRLEDAPVRDAIEQAPERLAALTERLAAELTEPSHAWTATQHERLRAAALSLLAVRVAGEGWREAIGALDESTSGYAKAVAGLARLPLVHDALGRARTLTSFVGRGSPHVHREEEPLPVELEPWLGDLLWVPPGEPAAVLLGDWTPPAAKALATSALEFQRTRDAWLREPPRPPVLGEEPGLLVRVPVAVDTSSKGVRGELALLELARYAPSRVSLRIEGRELEVIELELPVPIVAVLEHPGLIPRADYRAIERGPGFEEALHALRRAAVRACEALAQRVIDEGLDDVELAAVLRGGVRLALGSVGLPALGSSPLFDAPVWPLATSGWTSLRALEREVEGGVLGWSRGAVAEGPTGRTVVRVQPPEHELLRAILRPAVSVDYSRVVRRRSPVIAPGGAVCTVGEAGEAAIAWTGSRLPRLVVRHCGVPLFERPLSDLPRCEVVVDDPRIVPNADWSGLVGDPPDYPLEAWHRKLVLSFIDALGGSAPPALTVGSHDPCKASFAVEGLLAALAHGAFHQLASDRVKVLRSAKIVSRHGAPRCSLDALDAELPVGPLHYLPRDEDVPLDWHPVAATDAEAGVYGRLLGREFVSGLERLEALARDARRAKAIDRILRQSIATPSADWPPPRVTLEAAGTKSFVAALAGDDASSRYVQAVVRIEGRIFQHHQLSFLLPLRVDIDFPDSALDEEGRELSASSRGRLDSLTMRAARTLLRQIAQDDPSALLRSPPIFAFFLAWSALANEGKAQQRLAAELRRLPIFPAVSGDAPLAIEDALYPKGGLRIARWDEPWLERGKGERRSAYDAPIVRVTDERVRALAVALAPSSVHDLTGAVGKLQAERRVAQNVSWQPRIEGVRDARFRYPLGELLRGARSAEELFGVGVAALDVRTEVVLFDAGQAWERLSFDVRPRVRVAADSPLLRAAWPLDETARRRLESAMRLLVARLVKTVVETTPAEALPEWVRWELRARWLARERDLEVLEETPIFETSVGEWVSPAALRAQHRAHGPLWWTSELVRRLEPLDASRLALRLAPHEAVQLAGQIPCVKADRELELDAVARANMKRPPRESLAPSAEERAAALAVVELLPEPDDPSHGFVLLLRPGEEARRGLHTHFDLRPLGELPDPCAWPTLARMSDPELVPNRTWEAPEETARLLNVRRRVQKTVTDELARLLAQPEDAPPAERVSTEALELAAPACVEARVWLEPSLARGTLTVHDAMGERTVASVYRGRDVPLSGRVLASGVRLDETLLRKLFGFRLQQAALEVPPEPEPDHLKTAHVLHGIGLGMLERGWLSATSLPCFVPARLSVDALFAKLDAGESIIAAALDEADAVRSIAGPKTPVFVDDDSLVARGLRTLLRGRMREWRGAIRTQVHEALSGGAAEADPLEARLRELAQTVGVQVRIAERRRAPLVTTADDGVVLAGSHPVVRRLYAARSDPRLEEALRLLAVHLAAHAHRGDEAVGVTPEPERIQRLLG